ncbi:MAG: phospholipase D-like domain-containing protein [Acidithiobacillus sp.]|uniref:Phospholipase D-like domain-containing protein n=1 Tax=Acidithiobacillus ferruginosus TaxID=3063951 RepID=A0ACD5IGN2_9PROT|nr:phospholipase D-like domain-containing protein [Acidithiobacillus ferruginosus]
MLYIEPHAGPAPMVQVITDARHTVDLNVYYLSSKPILSALRRAHARGVNVRVILDQHQCRRSTQRR